MPSILEASSRLPSVSFKEKVSRTDEQVDEKKHFRFLARFLESGRRRQASVSNSPREIPDCRMIDLSVPLRSYL
jgi:hypothetical protein